VSARASQENVVVVTGASSGIGRQLAYQLADQGAWLALAARSREQLGEVALECRRRGGRALALPTDVAEQPQCRDLIERTVAEYGRIDTLINNAGSALHGRFSDLTDLALFEKVVRIDFFGGVYCTHYALSHLMQSRGRVIAVCSLKGKFPSANAEAYVASKHAMTGFFESLRMELAGSGVSVTVIFPAWVSTGMTSRVLRPDGRPLGEISALEKGAMPVQTCARLIVDAAASRKREVVMTLKGRAGLWLRLVAPETTDRILRKETE